MITGNWDVSAFVLWSNMTTLISAPSCLFPFIISLPPVRCVSLLISISFWRIYLLIFVIHFRNSQASSSVTDFNLRGLSCQMQDDLQSSWAWNDLRTDWLSVTLQLIQSPALAPLGLVMLKTTSEELACPREDLCVARKDELRKLLLEQVPTVLGLLTGEMSLLRLCFNIISCPQEKLLGLFSICIVVGVMEQAVTVLDCCTVLLSEVIHSFTTPCSLSKEC